MGTEPVAVCPLHRLEDRFKGILDLRVMERKAQKCPEPRPQIHRMERVRPPPRAATVPRE